MRDTFKIEVFYLYLQLFLLIQDSDYVRNYTKIGVKLKYWHFHFNLERC